MAFAMMGETERAWELFTLLSPIHHGSTPEQIERYQVEPYVMAADIYSTSPYIGRGGWTWYTGAAGWMYQLVVEKLLGLHLEVDWLRLAPGIPAHWNSYKIHYRYRETVYHLRIQRVGEAPGPVSRITMDGAEVDMTGQSQGMIHLVDDRHEHHVEVEFGAIKH